MHKDIRVRILFLILLSTVIIGTVSFADDSLIPLPDAPALSDVSAASQNELVDVIAQRAITQTSFNTVTHYRGMHLGGVHVHKYADGSLAIYAYDSGNSRILAFLNPNWTTQNELPDMVFGQDDSYLTGACNGDNNSITVAPTARTLCLNRGAHAISQEEEPRFTAMDTDTRGNLFVVDQYNNRLLMFLDPFGIDLGEGDTTADRVWGQPDFNSKVCNRGAGIRPFPSYNLTADGLCTTNTRPANIDPMFATGLDIDVWGNLWVTDLINNRVLRFPFEAVTGFPRLTADIVLGQPNFTSIVNDFGSCVSKPAGVGFCQLFYLQVNDVTGEIFIIHDQMNPLVSVYTPNTTAQNPTSYTYSRQMGKGQIRFPGFIHFLDAERVLVQDEYAAWKAGIHIFHTNGTLLRTITTSNIVGTTPDGPVNWIDIKGKIMIVDNMLFLTEQNNHNSIMVFDVSQLDATNQLIYAGEILGGPQKVWNSITGLGIRSPYGMTVSKTHNQIFVADRYRILVWNLGSPLTGRPADFVIGQPNFTSNAPTSSGAFVFRDRPEGMSVDEANNKLWVARNQEAYAFNLPITRNTPLPAVTYIARIPDSIYVGNLAAKGQPSNFVFRANDMVFNPVDQTVWIIDTDNSRAARVINPYSSTSRQVDLIIGQNNIDGKSCNRGTYSQPTARTLCFPGFGAVDAHGNLYIAEGVYEGRSDMPGNKRIVEYDKATIDAAVQAGLLSEPAADRVYAMPTFTATPILGPGFSCLANTPCNPIGIGFDTQGRMAVLSDAYFNTQNKRIYIYSDPLKNTGYVAFDPAQDTILPYSMGQGGMVAFAALHYGFYQDHTWNRVLVVHQNHPPEAPAYVQPADEAENLKIKVKLAWSAAFDANSDSLTYDVYLGQDETQLTQIASDYAQLSYMANLSYDTTYYWQIGVTDGQTETKGPVWRFTTRPHPIVLPRVIVSETSLAVEEAGLASYTLRLATQPSADVRVELSLPQQDQVIVEPSVLTFTSEDWNVPQAVVVVAIDDVLLEDPRTLEITHQATSEDTDYDAASVPAVTFTITDNDFELLANNSFELDEAIPRHQPDGWNITKKSKDRVRCATETAPDIAYEGDCAYVFQGVAGEKAVMSQTVRPGVTLQTGQVIKVRVVYRTANTTPALKVKLLVFYGKFHTAKQEAVINQAATDYTEVDILSYPIKNRGSITKLQLIFQNQAPAGKVYIDSVSLRVFPLNTGVDPIIEPPEVPQMLQVLPDQP